LDTTCLIVDDSKEFVVSATDLLESQGMRVVGSASSGQVALRLIESLRPGLALVDVELGVEDGIELAEEITRCAPWTKVVLISGREREDLGDLISGSAAAGFLAKDALSVVAIESLVEG